MQDALSGGYGAGGVEITPLRQVRASIEQSVTETYRGLYGIDPPKMELDAWTDRIIHSGNQLQRRGLSPDTAANEATTRAVRKIENTREAQFVVGNLEENTRLRDMIVRSVQVASGMSG